MRWLIVVRNIKTCICWNYCHSRVILFCVIIFHVKLTVIINNVVNLVG